MKPVYSVLVLSLLAGCAGTPSNSTSADSAAPASTVATKPATTDSQGGKSVVLDNSVSCQYEPSTGTRLRKKVCMTAEERKERADADREAVEQGRQRSRATSKANP
ncbi:MAG TPA: hypothetical protein VK629_04425 [Steroidobacteraceae bacterium]|nr:hypothetical protein [Steroidobacteraceae bacterium]